MVKGMVFVKKILPQQLPNLSFQGFNPLSRKLINAVNHEKEIVPPFGADNGRHKRLNIFGKGLDCIEDKKNRTIRAFERTRRTSGRAILTPRPGVSIR